MTTALGNIHKQMGRPLSVIVECINKQHSTKHEDINGIKTGGSGSRKKTFNGLVNISVGGRRGVKPTATLAIFTIVLMVVTNEMSQTLLRVKLITCIKQTKCSHHNFVHRITNHSSEVAKGGGTNSSHRDPCEQHGHGVHHYPPGI